MSPRFVLHTPADVPAFKARLGLPKEYVLFLGAGEPRKNEAGLLRAMALLPAGLRARYRAVIVGKIDPAAFAALLSNAGLEPGEAVLIPWVAEADLPALYSAAALFVFPSLHEGFGLPALEAMACGTATLASNNSSLPEVVGDPEALFDPTDPASISGRIEAVLSNPALLERLQAHGRARAATFTWEACAARAWDALESLPAKPAAPPGRPRLAFVSPLPPDASGIADYSAELLPALAAHYDITLFSPSPETVDADLTSAFAVAAEATLPSRSREFDRVLYQIGNSEFHALALGGLLPEVPGIVVQHDVYLSGALMIRSQSNAGGLPPLLFEAEGWAGLQLFVRDGLNTVLSNLPCSMPILRDGLGVIVHSRHAAQMQRDVVGPELRLLDVLPLLRAIPELPTRAAAREALGIPAEALVVTSFGMMAMTKCPDLVVAGFAAAFAGRPEAVLVFAGAPEPDAGIALRPAEKAGLNGRVTVTGRLPVEVYRQWLAATDVAVQLRRGSRGESSAALADAMAAGLPIIANAHGASAELPAEALVLLPDEADAGAIADALLRLADNPQARRTLGRMALDHAREHLSPEILAARYARAIEAGYAPSALLSLDRAGRRAAGTGADLRAVAAALAATFPRRLPRRLLLLSATTRGALSELSRALATVHRGWQVGALREEAGTLILDRLAAARALGLPAVISDEHFEAGPGDRLLVLSGWQECSAPAVHALRLARLAGATVILAGEPPDAKPPAWADVVIADGEVAAICQTDGAPAPLVLELAPDQPIFRLATGNF
ncbi:MAG: glycosyltransferase [Rubritepida sp.]|nr:glycosyltransferase [Rubritepida sp.]